MPTLFAVYNIKEKQMAEEYDKYLKDTKGISDNKNTKAYNINATIGGDDILGSLKIDISKFKKYKLHGGYQWSGAQV